VVAELSRQLGTNGLWIDHLTTLDPYPVNNDGNDDSPATVVDAPARFTYANVLFADNYWQNLGAGIASFDPDGEPVPGAYTRQLTDLSGGYDSDHSNVHLWYFGTIDLATPASNGEASITSAERTNWWSSGEDEGAMAGFYYSRLGGGDPLSTNRPLGAGYAMVRDGYNQMWDLGAGISTNRVDLPSNNGAWPNLIKFERADTNAVAPGQSVPVNYFYQWATNETATISVYLDPDANPLNTNEILLARFAAPGTNDPTIIGSGSLNIPIPSQNIPVGRRFLLATIEGGGRTRYLYSRDPLVVTSNPALVLDIARLDAGQAEVGVAGVPGQTIVLQSSFDLQVWRPIATNLLAASRFVFPVDEGGKNTAQFFRAVLGN
jgi:hypothetical protein